MIDNSFKRYSVDEIHQLFRELKIPDYRVDQLIRWVYRAGVSSYDFMTNIPKSMRHQLEEELPLDSPIVIDRQVSEDGTKKYLLEFSDGARVETVGMPFGDGRLSVCVSSQAGCAMNCTFCATGKAGFTRNLLIGEIVDQVIVVRDDYDRPVTNVVVMGQGEPFSNYRAVINALRIINDNKLLNIGARHITVSTCGLVDGIRQFSNEPEQFTLAVSLHSAIQSTRDNLMPAMRNTSLESLKTTLRSYNEESGRRFSFEYAPMKGVNDSDVHLEALISYCRGLLCHVNLIPMNRFDRSSFEPADGLTIERWARELQRSRISSTIRLSRGSDISAACGQLANRLYSSHKHHSHS